MVKPVQEGLDKNWSTTENCSSQNNSPVVSEHPAVRPTDVLVGIDIQLEFSKCKAQLITN